MTLHIIHTRIKEIGYGRYIGGCIVAGLVCYALAWIFLLGSVAFGGL